MLIAALLTILSLVMPPADCPVPAIASNHMGATGFASQRLSNLFSAMDLAGQTPREVKNKRPGSGQLAYLGTFSEGILLPLEIEMSELGCITHVGLDLFTEKEQAGLGRIGNFIERYMLELIALDISMRPSVSQADNVVFTFNGRNNPELTSRQLQQILNLFREKTQIQHQVDNFTYRFETTDPFNNHFVMHFPANAGLVSGMDKQEMEDQLVAHMTASPGSRPRTCQNPQLYSLSPYGKLLRSSTKEIHPGIRSEFFFTSEQQLLRDPQYLYETLNNLLLCPPDQPAHPLRVELKTYKGDGLPLNIDLASVVYYFLDEHTPYAGFARTDQDEIRGTLVFKNENFDYQHLLIIENLESTLSATPPLLSASLYLYIRNDNVKNLYGTYLDRQGAKMPVEINRP